MEGSQVGPNGEDHSNPIAWWGRKEGSQVDPSGGHRKFRERQQGQQQEQLQGWLGEHSPSAWWDHMEGNQVGPSGGGHSNPIAWWDRMEGSQVDPSGGHRKFR